MDWIFVRKNGGWWLKITTIQELLEYHDKTDNVRMRKPIKEIEENLEKSSFTQYAEILARKNSSSLIEGLCMAGSALFTSQLNALRESGIILINRMGGFHTPRENERLPFTRKKDLIWPNFSEKDIKISQFKGGTHYYATIGPMEVRDGDILKWDSFSEAYAAAKKIVD
jgi:hypothetical protein